MHQWGQDTHSTYLLEECIVGLSNILLTLIGNNGQPGISFMNSMSTILDDSEKDEELTYVDHGPLK